MPPIAVLDTNVLLSSLLSRRGNPFQCVALARAGMIASVTCNEILAEFDEKLRLRFGYTDQRASEAANEIRTISRVVPIAHQLRIVTADPDDDKILECAVAGGATHVVTGDKRHLLPLRRYGAIEIVSPADFIAITRASWPPT